MIVIFPAFHNKTQQVINYNKDFYKKTGSYYTVTLKKRR